MIKKPGFVFAGIGDTISLIKSITELGIKISGTQFYKDHHLYNEMDFKVPTGSNGDCFERFLVRVEEMRQSVSIIRQCLKNIPDGPSISNDPRIVPPKREIMKESMESLINHF